MGSRPIPGFARFFLPLRCSVSAPTTPLPPGAPLAAQAESGPDPTRVGFRPAPGLARRGGAKTCVARLRPYNGGQLWAGTQTSGPPARPGLRPSGGPAPSPMLLGPRLATPSPPAALTAAQAEPGPDPTRVGPRPDPGFARWAVAAPSPTLLGPCLATWPRLRAREGAGAGPAPREWAHGPTGPSPGKEGLRPPRASRSPCPPTPLPPTRLRVRRPALGLIPHEWASGPRAVGRPVRSTPERTSAVTASGIGDSFLARIPKWRLK